MPRAKSQVLIVLVGMIGLAVSFSFYDRVFPTASVNLQISRGEALELARHELESQGFDLSGYDRAVTFQEDDEAIAYLQKTLGMEQFNKLDADTPLRSWSVRFMKELTTEEFNVGVSPRGEITDIFHTLPEDAPGADLEQRQAQIVAETFLHNRTNIDLSKYELVATHSTKRENRTDHRFIWEASAEPIGEAKLRAFVGVQGDTVDIYSRMLRLPEGFKIAREEGGSKGSLLASISQALSSVLVVIAVIIFLRAYKNTVIPWKGVLALSVAMGTLSLVGDINALPASWALFGYSTATPFYTFWGEKILNMVQSALWVGGDTFLFATAGWAICREALQGRRNDEIRSWRDLLSRDVAHSSVMGYVLAFTMLGYVTAFYLVGERYLGVWSPSPSDYSRMIETSVPALYPLTASFQAAVSEELTYRFFAIALLMRYLKRPFVAVLIPAAIWAFGHSNYDVSPFYTRGIELTIVGLLIGYFFLAYGLISVIVAHYVYDAIIIGLPLLQSDNTYLFSSGIAVAGVTAIPIVIGCIGITVRALRERGSVADRYRLTSSRG